MQYVFNNALKINNSQLIFILSKLLCGEVMRNICFMDELLLICGLQYAYQGA